VEGPGTGDDGARSGTPWPLVGRGEELDRLTKALSGGARGIVVHGPAGVGKTRLASELLAAATDRGRRGGRTTATSGTASTPLGALAPLLPPESLAAGTDPVARYGAAAAALGGGPGDEAYVLLVDDHHHLDGSSATLLGQLLDAGVLFLLGTVRTGAPLPEAVLDLWRREAVVDAALGDLSADDVDALLHLALGGPVEGPTIELLRSSSRGNPLFLRELVLGALAEGRLVARRGVWRLDGPLPATARLVELVEARIAAVGGAARAALDLLALWEPIGLTDLEDHVGSGPLEALDAAGLLRVDANGRRQDVRLSHPLHGEVVRERLFRLTRRRLLLDHAARIERHGARRREDPLRVATARLEGAGSADARLLVTAARLARYGNDFREEARLARAAVAAEPTPEAALLLAEALHELGSFEEVERILADVRDPFDRADVDEPLAVQLVALRGRNFFWGLARLDDAVALNRAAQGRTSSAEGRDELRTDEAMILLFSGRPLDALDALAGMDGASPRVRALAAVTEIPALIMSGRCETAVAAARRALQERDELGDQLVITPPRVHVLYEVHGLTEAGRLAEAEELAAAGRRTEAEQGLPDGQMWFALNLGRTALLGGRPRTAARYLAEAVSLSVAGNLAGARRLILSLLATARAWSGDGPGAEAAVAELDALPPFAYLGPEQALGRGWAAVATGQPQQGREHLRAAAAEAAATGHRSTEAWLLHDVARLGDPGAVRDRLEELADLCEGDLVPLYAASAGAAAAGDPVALEEVANRFEALGATLLAAEAATAGSHAARRRGDQRAASRLLARSSALATRCEGARTPGLVSTEGPVPLTAREREIAVLAADGCPSKEIAERLYLSVRTVNNHLQAAYAKLGITSRAQLPEALRLSRVTSGP
jgi:DNA-binding CsgD family transcriptional regulator